MRNDMNSGILSKKTIDLDPPAFKDKNELFLHMTGMLRKANYVSDEELFLQALYEREDIGSTYMGDGIAMPHGKSEAVVKAAAAFCRCKPFQYISQEDVEDIELALMLAVPQCDVNDGYVRMLSSLSRLMLNDRFLDSLKHGASADDIVTVFHEELAQLT